MSTPDHPIQRQAHTQQLKDFLSQHAPAAGSMTITEDTALLGTGLLDSLAVIQLMLFLGSEYGIEIEDEDFTPENLSTVGALLNFIERKQSASA